MTQKKRSSQTESSMMFSIGITCLLTPIACLLFGLIGHFTHYNSPGWYLSVSASYFNNTAPLMVNLLALTAYFMLCYDVYDIWDKVLMKVQGVLCLLIILFPTMPDNGQELVGLFCIPAKVSFILHTIFSITLFVLFGVVCIFRFTKGNSEEHKRRRNYLYRTCGIVIWASILLLFILGGIDMFFKCGMAYVMLCEHVMLIAYAIAWLVKAYYHKVDT